MPAQMRGIVRWVPCIVFSLLPLVIVVLAYSFRTTEKAAAALGCVLATAFVGFLLLERRDQLPVIAAVIPNVLGPYLSEKYVEHHIWPAVPTTDLLSSLHSGGDTLIQIAFFFASVVALAVYLLGRISKASRKDRIPDVLSYLTFAAIIFCMAVMSNDFFFKSYFPGSGFLPDVTLFFIARALIALNGVMLSTWPTSH
jgi:hypothetical protein